MKHPQYIFIHHTAVSYKKNPDQWRATDAYHRTKNWGTKKKPIYIKEPSSLGYYGGYNYEVAADGSIKQFRQDGETTVAQYQQTMNDGRALSICLDMNGDIEWPTRQQRDKVKEMLEIKMKSYNISKENIRCHRSVATYKSCPGLLLPDDIYSYFITHTDMENENPKPVLFDWAKPAWAWAAQYGIINIDSEPTLEFQRAIVIQHRFWQKFLQSK